MVRSVTPAILKIIMKKTIITILVILALGAVTVTSWYFYNSKKYTPETYMDTPDNNPSLSATSTISKNENGIVTITPGAKSYTLAEIAAHNQAASCYSAVSGTVYDLTMWVNLHPGGKETILSMCGGDGTQAFMNEHKGRAKFMKILTRYKIGLLTQGLQTITQ
jgi:cytochrome b involved in lipid metabolism